MTLSSLAASLYPNLFHSLVLIDPVILQPLDLSDLKLHVTSLTLGALNRRDSWSSRQVDFFFFHFITTLL